MKRITIEEFVQDEVTGFWVVKTKRRWVESDSDEAILASEVKKFNRLNNERATYNRNLPASTLAEIMAAYDEYKRNCM